MKMIRVILPAMLLLSLFATGLWLTVLSAPDKNLCLLGKGIAVPWQKEYQAAERNWNHYKKEWQSLQYVMKREGTTKVI